MAGKKSLGEVGLSDVRGVLLTLLLISLMGASSSAEAQSRERELLVEQIRADRTATLRLLWFRPGVDLERVLSRGDRRPNLYLTELTRCEEIEHGRWRGREVLHAFAGARAACERVAPRHPSRWDWVLVRWGTDDDDFKDEAVGFAMVDQVRGLMWVVEYHWSWFER